MSLPNRPFWMVYGIGMDAPTHKHNSVTTAREEAKRLARKFPGDCFIVLEAVEAVLKREFDTVTFRNGNNYINDDDIPF